MMTIDVERWGSNGTNTFSVISGNLKVLKGDPSKIDGSGHWAKEE
jgi:hypothetical protein